MMQNLGIGYEVVRLGTQAAQTIKLRLQSGVPTLFCLWSPHPLNAQFRLIRIELPAYTTRALFQQGRSDFQTDVLEKVAAKNLAEISPDLEILYARFTVETATQERLMLAIDSGRQTVMQVCSCLHAFEPAGGVRLGDDRGKHGRLAIVASERSKHSVCVLRRG
jgi:ABC-type proline/glycine betaine transport system substrate-binding protein